MAGNKALTLLFHQIHTVSAWLLLGLIGLHVLAALFTASSLRTRRSSRRRPGGIHTLPRMRPALLSRPRMQRHVPMRQAAKQRWLKRSRRSERSTPSLVSVFGSLYRNFLFDWGINGRRQRSHWHVPPAGRSLLHEEVEVHALHDCRYWNDADTQELSGRISCSYETSGRQFDMPIEFPANMRELAQEAVAETREL